jgi:hypothetical protein
MSATSATVEVASGGSGLSAEQEMINQLVEEEIQLRKYGNLNEGLFSSRQQQAAVETVPWESDRASLGLIQSSLKKSDTLTSKMVRFEAVRSHRTNMDIPKTKSPNFFALFSTFSCVQKVINAKKFFMALFMKSVHFY